MTTPCWLSPILAEAEMLELVGAGTSPLILVAMLIFCAVVLLATCLFNQRLKEITLLLTSPTRLMPAVVAASLIAATSAGYLPWVVVDAVTHLSVQWLIASVFAQHALAYYRLRQDQSAWRSWTDRRRRTLGGFGLAGSYVVRYAHPLLSLAMLELAFGASAVLLAAEMRREPRKRRRGSKMVGLAHGGEKRA